jgi:hypothetical protein
MLKVYTGGEQYEHPYVLMGVSSKNNWRDIEGCLSSFPGIIGTRA